MGLDHFSTVRRICDIGQSTARTGAPRSFPHLKGSCTHTGAATSPWWWKAAIMEYRAYIAHFFATKWTTEAQNVSRCLNEIQYIQFNRHHCSINDHILLRVTQSVLFLVQFFSLLLMSSRPVLLPCFLHSGCCLPSCSTEHQSALLQAHFWHKKHY